MSPEVHTLDLGFQKTEHAIASYLIPTSRGGVLIESGPGSTIEGLKAGLKPFQLSPADITDVLLTHIHLDHAGAAGWLARQGARIYVHPNGAQHLLDPEKLLKSAARVYGDRMQELWGDFLPVPASNLVVTQPETKIEIDGLEFLAVDTPGHADHHFAYLVGDICFTGDVGGVRLPGPDYLCVPTPPPEFHLGKWRETLATLRAMKFRRIAPTHFGIFEDVAKHLEMLERGLEELSEFIEKVMPGDPPIEEIMRRYQEWTAAHYASHGIEGRLREAYETANPAWMAPAGIQRYWRKHRMNQPPEGGR
jgi:glyoxylase-like metal-dependent hydrolase (beta-lactamase superfamily II)